MGNKTEILDAGFFEENTIVYEEVVTPNLSHNIFLRLLVGISVLIFGFQLLEDKDWYGLLFFGSVITTLILFLFFHKTHYVLYKDRIEVRRKWINTLTFYIRDIENAILLDYDSPKERNSKSGAFGIEINIKFDAQNFNSWIDPSEYEFKTFKTQQMFLHLNKLIKEEQMQ